MKDNFWRDRDFMVRLKSLAFPIALQNLMLAAVAAADAIMLGRIEQDTMSAVSLASQIQFIQNMILASAVSAALLLGAQYWGKRDIDAVKHIFSITIKVSGFVSILFFVLCVFFPHKLMNLMTNEEILIGIGIRYLRIAGWSYLLTGFSQSYLMAMKISEHAVTAARISFVTVIINILLNAVLIFGLFGASALSVRGAAIATLIARIIELVWAVCVSNREGYVHLNVRDLLVSDCLLAKDYFRQFWPLLGSGLLWGVGFTAYTAFMGHLGTTAAAAASIATVIRDLLCCMCRGISGGGAILVGNELGAGKTEKGRLYGERMVKLAFLCGLFYFVFVILMIPVVPHIVSLSPEATKLLPQLLLILAVYMIGRAVNTILVTGLFSAGGDTMFDVYTIVVSMWMIAIPLAAVGTFVLHWPIWVIYACTCVDEVGKIPWVMHHFKKYRWVRDLTRKRNIGC